MATNPFIEDVLKVMGVWGFQYKTNIAWVKPSFGTGFYVRGQHELLLVGGHVCIGVPANENRLSSVIRAPTGRHNKKPEEASRQIERMYPNRWYLELFARNSRSGCMS